MPGRIIPVTDAEDPRLQPYLHVRERDLAGREGLFVVEGAGVVSVLVASGRFRVHSLLLSERRVAKMRDRIESLRGEPPVLVVEQRIMDAVVGFPIHRGVLALVERGAAIDAGELLASTGPDGVVVALVGVVNHDNVGGVFRNAAAFGASGILLDRVTCDPLYRKAVRVSAGGALLVPFARCASAPELFDALEAAGFTACALSPRGAGDVRALPRTGRRALLLGAEGEGLPADVLERASTFRIGMAAGFDSLNVAVASGIALHQIMS